MHQTINSVYVNNKKVYAIGMALAARTTDQTQQVDEHFPGSPAILLGIVGVGFFLSGLFTLFNALTALFNYSLLIESEPLSLFIAQIVLANCFVALNFFMAYGFVYRRRWVLPLVIVSLIFVSVLNLFRLSGVLPLEGGTASFLPTVMFAALGGILYVYQEHLLGERWCTRITIPFMFLLGTAIVLEELITTLPSW